MSESNKSFRLRMKKKEALSLVDMFQIVNKRKYVLLISMILIVLIAFIFNQITKPVYESYVLLKKDKNTQEKTEKEDLKDIVLLQTKDEIETEMELVKTREVLEKVIEKLQLCLTVDNYYSASADVVDINLSGVDYKRKYDINPFEKLLPKFALVKTAVSQQTQYYYIKKSGVHSFQIYDEATNKLIRTVSDLNKLSKEDSIEIVKMKNSNLSPDLIANSSIFNHIFIVFNLPGCYLIINWPEKEVGGALHFHIDGNYATTEKLIKSMKVEHIIKTDIFKIAVQSVSPDAAQEIANQIAEEYRELRINKQKESIRYSFNFIDTQLQDVWDKLKASERDLSQYKSSRQITSIDDNSKSLVNFLSSLEAEKIKTNLELTENENKLSLMQNELKNKGYIDETYLTPQVSEQSNSPFSNLLRQLSDLEIQRLELLQRRTENHPDVVMMDRRIKQIKDKLLVYNQNTLTAYQILINSSKKKQEELNSLTAKYTNRIEALPPEESRLAELIRQKNVYDKIFTMLLNQREQMRMAELTKLQDIIIVDQAHIPVKPLYPNKLLNLAMGLFSGIIIGFALIVLVELRDRRHISLEEIEDNIDIPIYAIIPSYEKKLAKKIQKSKDYKDRLVTLMEEQDGLRESYRVLKAKIASRIHDNKKIIMFTSCEENTGKTSIVSNLGVSLAIAGKKVLLIDCDLKKASLTKTFNLAQDTPGLIKYLNSNPPRPNIYPLMFLEKGTSVNSLDILPAGGVSESSGDLISSGQLEKLLDYLTASSYEFILIDTPPVTRVGDVLVLGKIIKNSMMIVRPGHTFRDSVEWGFREMEEEKIHIQGIIINACDIKRSYFKYRYGYGYGYSQKNQYDTISE